MCDIRYGIRHNALHINYSALAIGPLLDPWYSVYSICRSYVMHSKCVKHVLRSMYCKYRSYGMNRVYNMYSMHNMYVRMYVCTYVHRHLVLSSRVSSSYLLPITYYWYLVCMQVHQYVSVCNNMHPSHIHIMHPYASIHPITHRNVNTQHTFSRRKTTRRNVIITNA